MEQSVDGTLTVSFSCFPSDNNYGYELLQAESMITIEDYDFRVKQLSHTALSKAVTAISTFYDHTKTQQNHTFNSSPTLHNYISFALQGTGWEATIDSSVANLISDMGNFGNDNVVSLITKICKAFQCEYMILPNKKLYFAKQIGGDYDYQYRYKHNVSSVVRKEDTANLTTVMRGYGKDGLEVIYRSPKADIFGELEAEPIHDEQFTDVQAFKEYMANQIQDEPELVIESVIPELTKREIGERVWLIYEPLNIEMQTRILQQTFILQNSKLVTSSVVLGNTTIKSSTDLFVEQQEKLKETKEELTETIDETKTELKENIDEAKKEFQSKIDQADNRITIEVEQLEESIATIDIKADNISLSVSSLGNRVTQEMAAINLKADNISLSVNSRIDGVSTQVAGIDIKATEIQQSVRDLANNTNSSITQLSNNINLKIEKGGAITDINLSPNVATINANKINLNGAVIVNGSVSGATNISVSTDIYLGRRLVFNDMTSVGSDGGGGIAIESWGNVSYQGSRHIFYGIMDFSSARVVGLSADAVSVNGYTMTYTSTGGKKYITFRQNGSYLGQVEIN